MLYGTVSGCLLYHYPVCVLGIFCLFNAFYSFQTISLNLYRQIGHILKLCTCYIMELSFSPIFPALDLIFFSPKNVNVKYRAFFIVYDTICTSQLCEALMYHFLCWSLCIFSNFSCDIEIDFVPRSHISAKGKHSAKMTSRHMKYKILS